MRLLGAILAGGRATRFGSDKALALLGGRPLIEHARAALAPHVQAIVVAGRDLPDRPAPDLGPLGGIAAALHHAATEGYDAVLTIGCDTPRAPAELIARLIAEPGSAYVADLPVLARWPASLSSRLDAHLAAPGSRAIRRWAEAVGAVPLTSGPLANVNTPSDLAALQ